MRRVPPKFGDRGRRQCTAMHGNARQCTAMHGNVRLIGQESKRGEDANGV